MAESTVLLPDSYLAVVAATPQTDDALRRSETQLRLALHAARISTWEWNLLTGEATRSPGCEELFGFRPGEMPNTMEAFFACMHPDDLDRVKAISTEAIERGANYDCECRVVWPDGSVHWIASRAEVLRDAGGRAVVVMGVVMDVTERKRTEEALRESETRFRALADSMPQIVWTARADGHLDYYNRRWYDFTGFPEGETGDASWTPILHPDDLQRCVDRWYEAVRTGEAYEIEYRFIDRATGGYRWHLGRALPLKDETGRTVKWFGTCTDIHDLKLAGEKLTVHQSEIESLNDQLRLSMQETHHRVKNNLQVIAALVDMQLLPEQDVVPSAAMKRLGQHIQSLAVVHDLLTLNARNRPETTHLSARATLHRLVPLLETVSAGADLRVEADDVPLPPKHATSLAVLVNELISNAVKHGRGPVYLVLRRRQNIAVLAVSDDGPGFPPGFDPKVAANTGIELIEQLSRWDLGGSVVYANRPEGGASVVITFPIPA